MARAPKGVHRGARKDRIECAKHLMNSPDINTAKSIDQANESPAKNPPCCAAWGLRYRSVHIHDNRPSNPEHGFEEAVANFSRIGRAPIRIARMGDRYADGRMKYISIRKMQEFMNRRLCIFQS